MITDIALIVLVALILNYFFNMFNLPGLLGMIATGIVLGPSFLNVIDSEVLILLAEFKTAALIVILIRAGLGINKTTLKKIGGPAIKMSFIPGIVEGTMVLFASHYLLGLSYIEGEALRFLSTPLAVFEMDYSVKSTVFLLDYKVPPKHIFWND